MWTQYYGEIIEFTRGTFYNYPNQIFYIDTENKKIIGKIGQRAGDPYWMIPISALPFNHYYFEKEAGGKSEFEQIDENVYKEKSSDTYIYRIFDPFDGPTGVDVNYLYSTSTCPPGTVPMVGEYTDVSGRTVYFGNSYICLSGEIVREEFYNYPLFAYDFYQRNTSGEISKYGHLIPSAITDIPSLSADVLSSITLYGVYKDKNESTSATFGDSVFRFSYVSTSKECKYDTYDNALSSWHMIVSKTENNLVSRDDFDIKKLTSSLYLIGTSGVSPWYTLSALPSSTTPEVVMEYCGGEDHTKDLHAVWIGYRSFYSDIPPSAHYLFKDDCTEDILIADPWRWLE